MIINVLVQAVNDDDGALVWSYSINEKVPLPDVSKVIAAMAEYGDGGAPPELLKDAALAAGEGAGRTIEQIMTRLDEARESILTQAGAELPNIGSDS